MKLQNDLEGILLEKGIRKYQFAAMIKVKRQLLSRWCKNIYQPVKYLPAILKALPDVSITRLFYVEHNGKKFKFVQFNDKK